ncbi:papillote protein [Culex quinquefasciatus]|uniref:Papillote protein n=1 Tax=Culex quinquefasciatus TaxID=7176 RepID=B0X3Z1_CULQU|nr:papillote protein [Culex quinquefasciatus]|eukprot:XP_001864363.1 papillote protein [Culex quinquefasciatus]
MAYGYPWAQKKGEQCISGLKLPHHAHVSHQTQSVSGSDGALIPSDYPSESHSENEEVDTGSLPISSHGSYDNSAFLQDASSIYSDHYGHTQEIRTTANCEMSPKFDIHVRVKRTPPPLPSPLTSDTDSNTTVSRAERNNLSTILETHEDARNDVFTQTVTEKTTIEDVEKHRRMVTEYKAKPMVDPNWNVTIRNYQESSDPKWEDFSDVSSASGMTISQPMVTQMTIPTSTYISENDVLLQSPELVGNVKPIELPPEDKTITNWDVLIRVLQDVEVPDITISTASLQNNRVAVPLVTQLSYDDKAKWKEIITTESTLRTMLTEAVVREDFERIRADARYEKLFEPQSWEIIMRILAPADDDVELRRSKRSKKRETWDTRSRRSSLPTLYEYDSDGGSSVRTITQEPITITTQNRDSYGSLKSRSRKTSRSSFSSNNVDYRSMTEVMVDFAKPKYSESYSDESSYTAQPYYEGDHYEQQSVHRSTSHPSLARSASEFTERWIAPENTDSSTSEVSPQPGRRERTIMVYVYFGMSMVIQGLPRVKIYESTAITSKR